MVHKKENTAGIRLERSWDQFGPIIQVGGGREAARRELAMQQGMPSGLEIEQRRKGSAASSSPIIFDHRLPIKTRGLKSYCEDRLFLAMAVAVMIADDDSCGADATDRSCIV